MHVTTEQYCQNLDQGTFINGFQTGAICQWLFENMSWYLTGLWGCKDAWACTT